MNLQRIAGVVATLLKLPFEREIEFLKTRNAAHEARISKLEREMADMLEIQTHQLFKQEGGHE